MPSQRYRYQKNILQRLIFFAKRKLVLTVWVSTSLSKFGYVRGTTVFIVENFKTKFQFNEESLRINFWLNSEHCDETKKFLKSESKIL